MFHFTASNRAASAARKVTSTAGRRQRGSTGRPLVVRRTSPFRLVAAASATALVASLLPALSGMAVAAEPLATTAVNNPPVTPHALTAFPSRDFLSEDGLTPGDTVVFEVTHSADRGGATIASKPFVVGDDGLAEVNHPGGTCWDVVTPNIVAGDTVRTVVTASASGTPVGTADVTHVADVTAGRPVNTAPGEITLKGTAVDDAGAQFPGDQLDARLVAPGKVFAKTAKRDLRAPGTRGATFGYDEPGSTSSFGWTAKWTGLTDADVKLALGAEAMGNWLGRDPAAGVEGTIFETGAGFANGPQAPCTAPKEKLPPLPGQDAVAPTVPGGLTAAVSDFNSVALNWDAATDTEGVTNYGVYRNGVPIFTVQNAEATAPAPTTFVDRNVPPGDYTYTVDAADAIDNRSAQSGGADATAQPRPAAAVPVGNPPTHPFTLFPSRDMIDVEGVADGQSVRVEVIRNGKVVSDSSGLFPDETGLVEINHVGAGCWSGTTPDLHANDAVRATVYDQDGSVAWVDEATTANVTAGVASLVNGVVTIHGTAQAHDGKPLPVDQLENRLVSSTKNPFGANGKRTLRADAGGAAEGTLAYDPINADNPVGVKWTATYKGLDATDQKLATSVESRVMWLGRDPLAGLELTIFEAGSADPPGPAGPDCVAPFENIDTTAPSTPKASATAVDGTRDVDVAWTPSTDNVYVYGYRVFSDDKMVAQVAGDASTYSVKGVTPGTHTFAVEAFDSASATGAGATGAEKVQAGFGKPYGNTSVRSAPVSVTPKDLQAPSVPGNLQVTNPTNVDPTGAVTGTRNARLVFDPSTDDSGAAPAYEIYRDGVLLPTAVPTVNANGKMTYTDQRLTQGQTYRYAVLAKDAAGNKSAKTPEVAVKIAADTTAPTFTGTPSATVPDIHGRDVVISWEAATDDNIVTGYGVYRDGTKIAQLDGTVLSFKDVGLAPGTYKYKVDAVDSAGNRSDRAAQTAQSAAIANDPPSAGHVIIAYPARDFVEGQGYIQRDAAGDPVKDAAGNQIGQNVVVELFRGGKVVGQARTKADNTGLVEVNHAGPGCWGTAAFANTPDVRPGDVARITPVDTEVPDQTTAAGVYTGRPAQTAVDTVVVKGTAKDAAGKPLPLDQLEARVISANGSSFQLNGRKVLRAPGDGGTMAYDAAGSTKWTATYKGLSAADVTRALNGEMVINWLGRSPLIGNELTIFENGAGTDGGPAAGTACTAPLDPNAPIVSLAPAARLAFGDQGATTPASASAAKPVVLNNAGSSTVTLSGVSLGGANPGDFAVTPATLPATLAPGASVTVNVTFSPKAVGARSATLDFADDAANTSYQSIALTGNGADAAAPTAPTGFVKSLTGTSITTTVPVTLKWNASAAGTVSGYQLQKSVGGAAFAEVPAAEQPGTATTVTQQLPTSVTNVRYQVRACNGANCSAWVPLASFSLADFQENNTNISTKGTWTRSALAGSFGGSVSSNSTAGSSITLKTNGVGFQVISTKGPDRGNAEVWLNGTRVASVNLYAATVQPAQVVYTREGLANATHQVELRALGTRTAPSTANRVDLDGLIALR